MGKLVCRSHCPNRMPNPIFRNDYTHHRLVFDYEHFRGVNRIGAKLLEGAGECQDGGLGCTKFGLRFRCPRCKGEVQIAFPSCSRFPFFSIN